MKFMMYELNLRRIASKMDDELRSARDRSIDSRMNHDDSNLKTRRFPSSIAGHELTANKGRTSTPVDSFVQLNLTGDAPPIDIKLEDYIKVTSPYPTES